MPSKSASSLGAAGPGDEASEMARHFCEQMFGIQMNLVKYEWVL